MNRFKKKEDYRHLDKFLRQFNTLPSQNELKVLITKGELSEKSWLLLAHSYTKNGNFEKSIEIYNELYVESKNRVSIYNKEYNKYDFYNLTSQLM